MIAQADGESEHLIGPVEPELGVVLGKIEASQVVFPFSEHRHTSRDVILQAGFDIQPEFGTGLRASNPAWVVWTFAKKIPGPNATYG